MKSLLGVILMMALLVAMGVSESDTMIDGDIGMMPEVVVTAPRYGSEIGLMPEVIVTATRYEGEDIAYSGMMPEVIATAPRYTRYVPYVGAVPGIVITATRYEGEDIAYSGMMPEVVAVGSYHERKKIAYSDDVHDVSLNITLIIIRNTIQL